MHLPLRRLLAGSLGAAFALVSVGESPAQTANNFRPVFQANGLQPGGPIDTNTIKATGGSASRPTADLAGDTVNVRAYGAKGDGRRSTVGVTISSGTQSLTVDTSLFSSADVGKYVAVPGAGVTPTTGPVVAVPVATPGAGYASLPTVTFSGSGTGATATPFMALQTATVASGGVGCTDGSAQPFTVNGGLGEAPTLTGTVSGGVLSGPLTVTKGGDLSALPLSQTAALLTGPGCTSQPTVATSFGVGRVAVGFANSTGYTPATTASISGGSPSTAATLGTPQISILTKPLVARISTVASPTSVTLDVAASTSLSASSQQVFWATNDRIAIQNAINYAISSGRRVVYFPSGLYFKAYGTGLGAPLDPGTSTSLSFRGDGPEASVLEWDAGDAFNAGGDGALFRQVNGTAAANLTFSDMQFRGFLDQGRVNVGGPAFYLLYYGGLSFDNVKFFQVPWMAMQNEGIANFTVTNSVFDLVMRDQARCRTCSNVRVTGTTFSRSDDDSVALHQSNYTTAPGQGRRTIIVSNNVFVDTTGVSILGGREVTANDNICRRTKIGCIRVQASASEAYSPMYAITVANNQAFDTLGRAPFDIPAGDVFVVTTQTPRAGSTDTNVFAGANNVSTRSVVTPYGALDNNVFDTTLPTPAAYGVSLINNRATRTLAGVTSYSAWGFGLPMTSVGLMDFRVSEAVLRPTTGIEASANIVSLRMTGNDVMGARRCMTVSGDSVSPAFSRHRIEQNTCFDTWEYGLFYSGAATSTYPHVSIRTNDFILDPYRMSPGRISLGAWTQNYPASVGISMPTTYGPDIADNNFEELYQPLLGPFRPYLRDNVVKGQFLSGLAWSAANYGVGTVPSSGAGYNVKQTTGQTGAAVSSFTGNTQPKPSETTAMPTIGYWQKGDFVKNTDPATTAVYGWSRLTSGTANVAGTDWKTVPLQ